MPIVAADIKFKRSINTGPGNSTVQGNPNDSIGGFMSSTELTSGTLHDLFDVITGEENAASTIDYRCLFLHNDHATLTLQASRVWFTGEVGGGASAAFALDGTGITAEASASAQAERVASETTAPAGETFSRPTTKATGLIPGGASGDVAANSCFGVWVRRTATNSAALNNDGDTINWEGDTAA